MTNPQNLPTDVSRRALVLAREIDRLCRQPGRYCLTLDISADRQRVWLVEVTDTALLRRFAVDQHGALGDVPPPLRPPLRRPPSG